MFELSRDSSQWKLPVIYKLKNVYGNSETVQCCERKSPEPITIPSPRDGGGGGGAE